MATYKYFDFTLKVSFPKAGMHTLQKGNQGVAISRDKAKLIRDYYMKEGNEACSRILSTSTAVTVLEKITKKTGLEAIYTICQGLTGNVTADTVINVLKSLCGVFDPLPSFLIGDLVIAGANYVNIRSIFNSNK